MNIAIDRGNGIEEMDESLLEKRTGGEDNETDYTTWTEYYLDDVLVHRSVHVMLKEGAFAAGQIADLTLGGN